MIAATRKLTARLRAALHRAAHITRAALTASLATTATTLIRRAGAGFTADQLAKAVELIEDNAIHPLRDRIWLAVSTDGGRVHRCTAHACTCEAGIKGRRCYHSLAARVLEAA